MFKRVSKHYFAEELKKEEPPSDEPPADAGWQDTDSSDSNADDLEAFPPQGDFEEEAAAASQLMFDRLATRKKEKTKSKIIEMSKERVTAADVSVDVDQVDENDNDEGDDADGEGDQVESDDGNFACELCPEKILKTQLDVDTHLASAFHHKRKKAWRKSRRDAKSPEEKLQLAERKRAKRLEKGKVRPASKKKKAKKSAKPASDTPNTSIDLESTKSKKATGKSVKPPTSPSPENSKKLKRKSEISEAEVVAPSPDVPVTKKVKAKKP